MTIRTRESVQAQLRAADDYRRAEGDIECQELPRDTRKKLAYAFDWLRNDRSPPHDSYVESYWREVGSSCMAPDAITDLERLFKDAGFSDDQIAMSILIADRYMRTTGEARQ